MLFCFLLFVVLSFVCILCAESIAVVRSWSLAARLPLRTAKTKLQSSKVAKHRHCRPGCIPPLHTTLAYHHCIPPLHIQLQWAFNCENRNFAEHDYAVTSTFLSKFFSLYMFVSTRHERPKPARDCLKKHSMPLLGKCFCSMHRDHKTFQNTAFSTKLKFHHPTKSSWSRPTLQFCV